MRGKLEEQREERNENVKNQTDKSYREKVHVNLTISLNIVLLKFKTK